MPKYPGAVIDLQVKRDGSIRDAVSGAYATITRTGSKYGLVDGRLVEYPANKLAAERYPSGKGWWAAIEEQRINYLLNSRITSDAAGIPTSFSQAGGVNTKTYSRVVDGGLLGDAGRVQVTGSGADSNSSIGWFQRIAGFIANDVVTVSCWIKGSIPTGSTVTIEATARTSADGYINATVVPIAAASVTGSWTRVSATLTCGAGTTKVDFRLLATGIDVGDVIDLSFCNAQMEKGTGATSYIPTTTASVTRPADVVTFPTTALDPAIGTFAMVAGPRKGSTGWRLLYWYKDSANRIAPFNGATNTYSFAHVGAGVSATATGGTVTVATHCYQGRWQTGAKVSLWVDGAAKTTGTTDAATPVGMPTTMQVGSAAGEYGNASLHRLVLTNTALSDAEIATLSTALLAGVSDLNRKRNRTALGGF